MTSDDQPYRQTPRTAWMLYLRREAQRMNRAEVSTIAHVGIIYATFADWDGRNIRPGVGTLVAITGRSEDTVSRCLTALAGAGLIERKRRQGGKTAVAHLLAPLSETIDWEPLLGPFAETRQAAYRRRQKSKAAAEAAAENSRNPSGDGFKNPSPSVTQEPVPVGGTDESRTRPGTGGRPVPGRVQEPVPVGGVLQQSSTSGRDTNTDREMPGVGPQPQVRAGEAETNDRPSPNLQALAGGGRGQAGGQSPLLLSVHTGPATPLDHALIAAHMTDLYGVPVPVRTAATTAVRLTDGLDLPDPTAYVLQALAADPDQYRPDIPDARRRAAGDS